MAIAPTAKIIPASHILSAPSSTEPKVKMQSARRPKVHVVGGERPTPRQLKFNDPNAKTPHADQENGNEAMSC
jgi:hypothetical protein